MAEKHKYPLATEHVDSEKHLDGQNLAVTGESPETQAIIDQINAMPAAEYAAMEKKLLRKMDLRLIPWMTLLYLMSFLDRVNIGAAKLQSLEKDLGLSAHQYSIASMIFFVSYVAFEVPSNLVLKKLRPSIYIPVTMVVWSLFQIFMGLVKNYEQLLAMRFMLGMAEAGLFPGLNFYLNGWYRRNELSRRTSFFFAGAVAAGAFGGIFGYALGQMKGIGGLAGWSWIFIIEGLLTFVCAIASFWMIHDWPDKAKFLTEFERQVVLLRLKKDTGLAQKGGFSWKSVKRGFTDWKTPMYMLCYIGAAECIYSQSLFAPTIVKSLGTWSAPQSLLLSTPPYVLAFITTMATGFASDHFLKRGVFNMGWSALGTIGYIILLCAPTKHTEPWSAASYFAVFLTTMSIAPLISNTISWCGNNFGGHYKKAVAMGMVFSAGNSGGIIASFAYDGRWAPAFRPGHATAMAFCAMNGITSLIIWLGLRAANRKREEMYGPEPGEDETHDVDDPEYRKRWGLEGMTRDEILNLGDDHPAFRFIL